MTTRRLEAFSDGVFAIAITLLILDVHVPEDMTHAAAALRAQWPSYLGYAVSFAVIGIIWTNHHAALAYVGRVDRGFQYLNLMLLAAVAFIPFPTALLARALQDGEGERVAAAVYGGASTAMGLSFGALWLYAAHRPGILRQALPQCARGDHATLRHRRARVRPFHRACADRPKPVPARLRPARGVLRHTRLGRDPRRHRAVLGLALIGRGDPSPPAPDDVSRTQHDGKVASGLWQPPCRRFRASFRTLQYGEFRKGLI